MTYKAVIFDLDGTLVNPLEDLANAMNKALEIYNYPKHSYEAYQDFIGNGIRSLVAKALPEMYRDEAQIKRSTESMIEIYRNHITDKTKPYDGIIDLLEHLKSQKLKLNVLSNKEHNLTKKVVKTLLPHYFEYVEGLSKEAHKKPNPIKALEISKNLGIKPEEIIYVGDTGIDMETANNANMFAVGVSWGFRTKKELIDNGAKLVINLPWELNAVLKKADIMEEALF
ncbi:HAD family hydrolase [Thalassobellus citreus]|uniref:HAD family hydrolase n=1 Tax=Thalassobellus citreus TaxID=3367752 RepID=UPI0037AD9B80